MQPVPPLPGHPLPVHPSPRLPRPCRALPPPVYPRVRLVLPGRAPPSFPGSPPRVPCTLYPCAPSPGTPGTPPLTPGTCSSVGSPSRLPAQNPRSGTGCGGGSACRCVQVSAHPPCARMYPSVFVCVWTCRCLFPVHAHPGVHTCTGGRGGGGGAWRHVHAHGCWVGYRPQSHCPV